MLEAAGTSLDNVVKCNIYLTSMSDFGAVNEVYAATFSQPMPVNSPSTYYQVVLENIIWEILTPADSIRHVLASV